MRHEIQDLNDDELDRVVGGDLHIRDHRNVEGGSSDPVGVLEYQLMTIATTVVNAVKNLPI